MFSFPRNNLLRGIALATGLVASSVGAPKAQTPLAFKTEVQVEKSKVQVDLNNKLKLDAYVEMCTDNAILCQILSNPIGELSPTAHIYNEYNLLFLSQLNKRVNSEVEFVSDIITKKIADHWGIAFKDGDCEDVAMNKYHELQKYGYDPKNMHFLIVKTETGEGHMVLSVKLYLENGVDYVTIILDNRHDEIFTLDEMFAAKKYTIFGLSKIVKEEDKYLLNFYAARRKD